MRKKKWSKGKQREKLNASVLFDDATFAKMKVDIPKMKLITPSTTCERLKCNASLARAGLKELEKLGLIRPVLLTGSQVIYTRATNA